MTYFCLSITKNAIYRKKAVILTNATLISVQIFEISTNTHRHTHSSLWVLMGAYVCRCVAPATEVASIEKPPDTELDRKCRMCAGNI